jgi:hypothetical protein
MNPKQLPMSDRELLLLINERVQNIQRQMLKGEETFEDHAGRIDKLEDAKNFGKGFWAATIISGTVIGFFMTLAVEYFKH